MADVKISELPALTTPDGAEELVVNDAGTTKKITITNATSGSLAKAGGTISGNVAITGKVKAAAGTVTAPSVTFTADPDTGIFNRIANTIGIVTNGTQRLEVDSAGNFISTGKAFLQGAVDVTGNVIATGTLSGSNGTTGEIQLGKGTALTTGAGTYDSSIRWNGSNGNLLFSQGAVEKMRITNTGLNVTGKVGIGTSSINGLLQIGDASAEGTQAAPALQIGGNTAYRLGMYTTNEGAYIENKNGDDGINFIVKTAGKAMKLSATGKLAVGNTASATGTTFNVRGNGSTAHLSLFEGTTAGDVAHASIYIVKKDTNSTSAQSYIAFVNGGAASGEVTGNGASQAAFSAWSDSRLKENVVTLPSQLDNIMALRPVEFDYKDGSGHQIGFIAQELKEVYPCCVSESADTGMLKVGGWNKTEARLVKAMQEQQVLIELLTARITVLEEV